MPRIMAVVAISLAKVLRLFSMSSSFDRRVKRASCTLHVDKQKQSYEGYAIITCLKLPYSAGTKHPLIAKMVSKPICRKYVLFPITSSGNILEQAFECGRTRHAI